MFQISGWWYTYPSEKYEVSWGDEISNIWKKNMFQTTKQQYFDGYKRLYFIVAINYSIHDVISLTYNCYTKGHNCKRSLYCRKPKIIG